MTTTPDRGQHCDRCGAAATHLASLRGGELVFCGPHHELHRERLDASGAVLIPLPGRVVLRAAA